MTDENASQQENPEMEPGASQDADRTVEAIQQVPLEDMEALQNELDEWKAKANEYLDGWQRARADYANYKKRVERDQAEARQNAAAEVLARILPALDDFE